VKLSTHAPAKLNLCLYVGDRRRDGLHEICSLFQAVTLADIVTMELAPGDSDEVICPEVEGENLAAVALAAFRERFGWHRPPVRVTIEKHIPIAGGLGGGSADAGAVLRLATHGSGVAARVEELQELAMSIGSDVPSQVEPGSHLVLGAGEVVERLPKTWHVAALLLTTDAGLHTGGVYEYHDRLVHERGHHSRQLEHDCGMLTEAVTLSVYDPLEFAALLQNDLEPAALELFPEAGNALELLREAGAEAAHLSGSGPTAFGLFGSREAADAAQAAIAPRWSGGALTVHQAPSDYTLVRSSED